MLKIRTPKQYHECKSEQDFKDYDRYWKWHNFKCSIFLIFRHLGFPYKQPGWKWRGYFLRVWHKRFGHTFKTFECSPHDKDSLICHCGEMRYTGKSKCFLHSKESPCDRCLKEVHDSNVRSVKYMIASGQIFNDTQHAKA